jgi:putative ABC transport system permease protein
VGAFKTQLISQYLSESILIALFAMVVSIGFAFTAVGWLNEFTSKSLTLHPMEQWPIFAGLAAFAMLVGILAGIYPAFVISGFKPATILKGQQGSAKGKAGLRKFLVVTQFSISIVLIIATMITYQQLQFMNNRDLGYNKDQVVSLRFFSELVPTYDALYNELLKQSSVKNVARSSRTPTGRLLDSNGTAQVQQGDSLANTNVVLKSIYVDDDFFETYEVKMAAGRNFSKEIKSDDSLAFVVNEAAVKMMGLTNDEILAREVQYGGVKGRVIGVVKDFHFESLHESIVPVIFLPNPFYSRISVKIAGDQMKQGVEHIEKVWKEFLPHRPFEYSFLSQQYSQLYDSEKRLGQLFTIFAGLAVLIACLGLFGLATFNTLQRVKEIGIRKVLGASVFNIVRLLSMEIIILIVVANLIAWPVAWYFMNQWLESFAYHVGLDVWLYVIAAFAAIVIALLTVGMQTLKAATRNPANTLRYE